MDKLFRKRKDKRAKQTVAPLPALPPSLNVDIRNSLIMPGMTERFSVLLPSLSSAPEVSVRTLLEQQRARGQGPSLTREEEDLFMEEMRYADEQQQRQQYGVSQSLRSPSNGAPSQRTASAISDWDGNPPPMEGDWNSVRHQTEMRGSSSASRFGSSDGGTLSPRMSPSNSGNVAQGNYASLDEFVHERSKMQGRSYGFAGKASFSDNNYLLKVQKSQTKNVDDYHDGLSSPSTSLRPPLDESDGGSHLSSRRPSNGSHRTLTPQPPAAPTLPDSTENSSLPHSKDDNFPKEEEVEEEMLAEEAEHEDDAFMSPLTRAASTIRRNPSVQSQGRKRQSMLIGMSPAQAKRISVALFEIESHLRHSTLIELSNTNDAAHPDEELEAEGREEILEGESRGDSHTEQDGERRPSVSSTSGTSSVFPYHASPASTHGAASVAGFTQRSQDNVTSPLLSAVSTTHELGSPLTESPTLPSSYIRPSTSQSTTQGGAVSPSYSSTLSPARGHQPTHSVSSTVYSEDSETTQSPRQPTLVPTRPQPARYTPSPAYSMSGYVPGQPRPVGSVRQASISSRRSDSIGSPSSTFASPSQLNDPYPNKVQYPSGIRPPQGRSVSQPLTSTSTSRSQTPTQGKIDHVPAPGALAARHQQSNSIGETFGWRSGSALAMYSPTRGVIDEADEGSSSANGTTLSAVPRDLSPQLSSDKPSPTSGSSLLFPHTPHRADSVISCVSTYAGPTDDNSPWNVILNEKETLQVPGDDQDRADLDLLRSMSGMGKEELSLIQGALVEKAKNERDHLRSEHAPATPSTQSGGFTRSPSQPSIAADSAEHTDKDKSGTLSPSSSMPEITAGHVPGRPPQQVSREHLPQGPPPLRPQHPSETTTEATPESSPVAAVGHDRSGSSGRKWIDDDPEAKRDIEQRIANATSELFRVPSRNAHKRSLSKSAKKAISSPTLVSYSANVPVVPIASNEKEKKKEKGLGGHKLSLRWKKKKRSLSGTPELPTPSPTSTPKSVAASTPATTPTPTSKTRAPTPPSAASMPEPHQEVTVPNDSISARPDGSQTAPLPASQPYSPVEEPPVSAPPETRQAAPTTDLNGFRFPRAPTSTPNVPAPAPVAVPERARTMSQVVELSRRTHKSTGSEDTVAISRFFEAGRALGLGDDQLNDMLRQNNRTSTTRSYHSTAPTTTSFSHSHSASQSHTHNRSLSQSLQSVSPVSPTYGNNGNNVLQPPHTLARIPSPIEESSQRSRERPQSGAEAPVLRRTIVVANEEPVPETSQHTPPAQERSLTPTSPGLPNRSGDRSPKRGNSIRRKPIQLNSADRELVASSPKSGHSRDFSGQSGVSESFDLPPRIQDDMPWGAQTPQSAGDRSSMGVLNSSTQGSIYSYYNRDSPSQRDSRVGSITGGERASQAVEITEYADGRVVWNILNAMRDEPDDPDYEGNRESLAESLASDTSTSEQRREGDLPWRLGPTPGLSFMRRPETRVYYTSSADVSDLIDQLSSDVSGAARGRIDIRPQVYSDTNETENLYPTSSRNEFDPAQFADAPSPYQQGRAPSVQASTYPDAHVRYAAAMGANGNGNGNGNGNTQLSAAYDGVAIDSPSAASFGSDVSGANERSVEERLQALMDRLRAAPGGVGREASV